ncbi:MAG TPA: protein kinase [Steroidobacteraceae bacterium]|jgi:serine/threonine protein kinase|nr:protein kinase [Steroidobacteraceae bacterium]
MTITRKNWSRLSGLLDEALELPEAQRLEWLEQLRLDDESLKSQLRELLMAANGQQNPLEKPPDFQAALQREMPRFTQATIELRTGHLIGPYRLIHELGRGGMGAVWLAERVDGKYKREVALKFPYAGPYQQQLAERLIREREILAALQHANIARMYDADITESGQPFLVLEYINGIAIHQYCDDKQLDLSARLLLFQQVLNAVRYAHDHSVIHRDLKPSNILITPDGIAHLLDFGIATLITDGQAHETPLTTMGGHLLTPEYASPEQVERAPITTASDVYSLGVVLYELLTGLSPYPHNRDQKAQLEQDVVNGDVITPSRSQITSNAARNRRSSPQQLRRTLRGELDTLLLKSLKKEVSERYLSVDTLNEDIRRYLAYQPILAQRSSHWYQIKKFAQRNRVVVASFAAIMFTMAAGTSIALWQARQAQLERDRAIASAARSEAVSDFVQLMLTEVNDGNQPITIQQLLERSESIATKTYFKDNEQHAAILEMLGEYYLSLGELDRANSVLSQALIAIGEKPEAVLKARLLCLSAVGHLLTGDRQLAIQQMTEGLATSSGTPEVHARCLETRAYFEYEDGQIEPMLADLHEARRLLLGSGVNKPELNANLLSDLGTAYAHLGRYQEADNQFSEAVAVLNSMGRSETTTVLQIENNWASIYVSSGNPLNALKHFDEALRIARKRGVNPSANDLADSNRARALFDLRHYQEAYAEYQSGLEKAEKQGDLLAMVTARQGMAEVLIALGNLDEAERRIREADSMLNQEIPNRDERKQYALALKGMLAVKHKRYKEAIDDFSQNIDFFLARKMQHGGLLRRLILRSETYFVMQDYPLAKADAVRAYDIAHKMTGDGYSSYTGNAALLLAKVYVAQNQRTEANQWASIAVKQLEGSVGTTHPDTIEAKELVSH